MGLGWIFMVPREQKASFPPPFVRKETLLFVRLTLDYNLLNGKP